MAQGADQGFAACYRRYRLLTKRPGLELASDAVERVYLDGNLVNEVKAADLNAGVLDFPMIERDEYLFGYSTLQIMDQFARQQ